MSEAKKGILSKVKKMTGKQVSCKKICQRDSSDDATSSFWSSSWRFLLRFKSLVPWTFHVSDRLRFTCEDIVFFWSLSFQKSSWFPFSPRNELFSLLSFCFSFPCTLVSFESSVDFVEVVQSKTGSNTIEHGILVTHHEFWVLLSLPSFRRRKSSNYSPHFYHLSSSPRFPGKVLFCTFRLCSCLVLEQRRKVRASRWA